MSRGLEGALHALGLTHELGGLTKQTLQELAGAGGYFSIVEALALLDYCEADVVALASLWNKIVPAD